jgi:hypothetical protein
MINESSNSAFIESYNRGFNEYLNNMSGAFFERIDYDKSVISKKAVPNSVLAGKIAQIDALKKSTAVEDNYAKLKLTGKILYDITPDIAASGDDEIKRSGANIINSFFEVARQTEDETLLKIAADISSSVNK